MGEISFGTFVDQYVLLLTYKFQTSMQTMISSSCKTALHYNAPKQLKIFFETTRPISLAHKNGHRILHT